LSNHDFLVSTASFLVSVLDLTCNEDSYLITVFSVCLESLLEVYEEKKLRYWEAEVC